MQKLRGVLGVMIVAIFGYTAIVVARDGFDFLTPFLNNLAAMTWTGQFNLDFLFYLVASGFWVAWRHKFSTNGLVLGAMCGFGMLFFAPYLLVQAMRAGSVRELVLGAQAEA